jgi:hypothetical protein
MILRPSKEEIEEYRNSPAINQSKLKLLLVSVDTFKEVKEPEMFFEEKEHFVIGKGVDDFITMGQEYFDQEYYLSNNSKPSATIMSIVQQVFQSRSNDDWFAQDLLSAIDAHAYQPNWKLDTKVKKVSEEGEQYWLELVQSEGKNVLSIEQFTKIQSIVTQLFEHAHTKVIFEQENNVDVYYQLPIYFEEEELQCKALLDMVVVDHNSKEITPYDIKTLGDYTKFFDYQCKKRRYDIQAAFYFEAISDWRDMNFSDYELNPFSFIVASTTKQCPPLEFVTTPEFLNVGKFGYEAVSLFNVGEEELETGTMIKGFSQLLSEYKWYEENGWDVDKEIYDAAGVFYIGSDYKKH